MPFLTNENKKTLILLTGCAIIPLAVMVPLFILDPGQVNISGILNDSRFGVFYHLTGLFMLGWSVLMMRMISSDHGKIILFAVTAFLALFLPYDESRQLISLIHIGCAYAGFVFSSMVLYPVLLRNRRMLNLFSLCILFCILHSFSAGQVTGLSECVFAAAFSVTVSLLAADKEKNR